MKANILVTGASGFIARKVIEALQLDRGLVLSALVRNPDRLSDLAASGVHIYKGDITKPEGLKEALTDKDVVIHSAALMSNFDSSSKKEFYMVNVRGTENLLSACDPKTLKRFIHISTTGVCGTTSETGLDEDAPYGKRLSAYEWSKQEAELTVLKYAKKKGARFTIVRVSQVYGPGMRYGWPGTIRSIKTGRFVIAGNGLAKIHLVYIADLLEAIKLILYNPAAENKIYNIAGPEVMPIGEVFDIISEILNVKPPGRVPFPIVNLAACALSLVPSRLKGPGLRLLTRQRLKFFSHNHVYDISKARAELGYNPRVDVREGLGKMVRWCEEEGLI